MTDQNAWEHERTERITVYKERWKERNKCKLFHHGIVFRNKKSNTDM